MNEIIGNLCKSTCGRDNEKIYLIYSASPTEVCLVDGNARKIKNPKKKNIKHIKLLEAKSLAIQEKIAGNLKVFDSEIYSFIKNFKK